MAGVNYLPKYDLLILDEAHTVEDVASDHFGVSVSESQVGFLLHSLQSERTGKGFLPSIFGKAKAETLDRACQGCQARESHRRRGCRGAAPCGARLVATASVAHLS